MKPSKEFSYTIRPATAQDAPAIARVHVDTWRTTYVGIVPEAHLARMSYERSQAGWLDHLAAHPQQVAFVALAGAAGEVIGFATCGPIREPLEDMDAELYGLYLRQAYQGQGIGRALVLQVVVHLRQQGFRSMALWCLKENPTCGFYRRLGGQPGPEKTFELGGKPLVEVSFLWRDLGQLGLWG